MSRYLVDRFVFTVDRDPDLVEMGAHPFLTLRAWTVMVECDHTEPPAMQLDFAAELAHVTQPYPDIST